MWEALARLGIFGVALFLLAMFIWLVSLPFLRFFKWKEKERQKREDERKDTNH